MVATRTFFREESGIRHFLEVSWSGPEVETVTGKVGAAGRSQTKTFETEAERDEWVAKRIDAALRQGYVEGNHDEVPVPEHKGANNDVREAERVRKSCGVPAFVPIYSTDDARDVSKLGGTPWLDTPWPVCPTCTQPLRFVLQLRRDEVPASCRWAFCEDLIQLFLCDASGKPGVPRWLCQADGQGWEPFAPSTLVRQVAIVDQPIGIHTAMPPDVRMRVARFEHAALDAYCQMAGDPPLPEPAPARIASRADQLLQVPQTADEFRIGQLWLYPPKRMKDWDERLDVPAYGDIDLDQLDLLEKELGLKCYHLDKLAGAPAWAQDPLVPSCRKCRSPMRYLFQVVTNGPIQIGGDGIGWLFICPSCHDGTFTWQR